MTVPFASRVEELFGAIGALAGAVLPLGAPAGAALALAGLAALTVATRRRRVLAAAGGAAVGALAAMALRGWLTAHLALAPVVAVPALAAAGALGCAALPVAFPVAAAALPGALLGALVPLAGRPELGAGIAAAIAGVLGLMLARLVSAAFASLCGGLLLALGLLAAFGRTPLARELADRPAAVAGFALVFGVAGAVFQLARSPEVPEGRSPVSPP